MPLGMDLRSREEISVIRHHLPKLSKHNRVFSISKLIFYPFFGPKEFL